jgi:uncharacterized protein (UPF0332 family)
MPLNPKADPILSRFRAKLDEIYGDRLERVVLCGLRARGDEHPDSDYDFADYLDKAHRCIVGARTTTAAGLPHVAAREAYLALSHAAEAYIFEHTDKAAKTHRGVRSQFGGLAGREPGIGREFLTFLAEAYEFKTIADYGIGPPIDAISPDDAASAINTAGRFIDAIAELLAGEARVLE